MKRLITLRSVTLILCIALLLPAITGCTEAMDELITELVVQWLADEHGIDLRSDDFTDSPDAGPPRGRSAPADDFPASGDDPVEDGASPGKGSDKHSEDRLDSYRLDMGSAEAFIDSVLNAYHVILIDEHGFLSDHLGVTRMREIEVTLRLFSPGFIREMVSIYQGYGSRFIIRIEDYDETTMGYASWERNGDLLIVLHYDKNPTNDGITHSTLAHELAHAAHFLVEEVISERRSQHELRMFNGRHTYTGPRYQYHWNERIHGTTFAYPYGMYDYHEDWATIIEMFLTLSPQRPNQGRARLADRLSDPRNETLLLKSQYIRDMMYKHISRDCHMIFYPLYEAEALLAPAAA